jgi:outer membrane protein TolC
MSNSGKLKLHSTVALCAFLAMSACGAAVSKGGTETDVETLNPVPVDPAPADIGITAPAGSSLQAFLAGMTYSYRDAPSVRAAILRVLNKEIDADDEARLFRPSLTAQAATYDDGIALIVEQPLFDFGQRAARVAKIEAEADSERFGLSRDRDALLRLGLFAILDADHARHLSRIHQNQIADFTQARNRAQRLSNINVLTQADVRLASVEVIQSEAHLATARINGTRAERVWHQIADNMEMPRNLDIGDLTSAADIETPEKALAVAFERNLDLRSIHVQDANLNAQANTLASANLPTINVSAQSEIGSNSVATQAGLTISIALLAPDARSRLKSVQRSRENLQLSTATLHYNLEYQLQDLALQVSDTRALVEIQDQSVSLLRTRVADLEGQLESGLSSYPEVIQARSDMYEVALDVQQNRYQISVFMAEILLLSGALVP